jgi:hypothetical protein
MQIALPHLSQAHEPTRINYGALTYWGLMGLIGLLAVKYSGAGVAYLLWKLYELFIQGR